MTAEQVAETEWFKAQIAAVAPRARVVPDAEGWPTAPGALGQVETALDRKRLAVYTTHRIVGKLLAIPGMRKHQMGDDEARMRFSADDPECLRAVLALIGARTRRVATPEAIARIIAVRPPMANQLAGLVKARAALAAKRAAAAVTVAETTETTETTDTLETTRR